MCRPPFDGWSPGAETTRPPPQRPQSSTRGPEGTARSPPPSPPLPPLSPTQGQPEGGQGDGGPAPTPTRPATRAPPPPRMLQHLGRGATAAVRAAVPRVPPVSRPPTPAVPAARWQPCAGAQGQPAGRTWLAARGREPVQCAGRYNDDAARLGARPGGAERRTKAERPPHPPAEPPMRGSTPTTRLPCQTDPPAASQTAPSARGCQTAPAGHAAGRDARRHASCHEVGPGPGATGHPPGGQRRVAGNHGANPPPLSPHSPPGSPRDAGDGPRGCRPSTPLKARGSPPPPPWRGPRRPGRDAAKLLRHEPPDHHPPAPTATTTVRRTRASTQGRHANYIQGQHANMNRSSMEATPTMNLATPITPALVPARGRQRDEPS